MNRYFYITDENKLFKRFKQSRLTDFESDNIRYVKCLDFF